MKARLHVLLVWSLILFGAHPAAAFLQASSYAIPFKFDPLLEPKIVLQMRVNGQGPFSFIYDTGMNGPLLFHESVADKLGLKATGVDEAQAPTAFRIRRSQRVTLTAETPQGTVTMKDIPAAFADLSKVREQHVQTDIAGFVGASLLDTMKVQIDFARKTMTLFPKGGPGPPTLGAATVPLTEDNGLYWVTISPTQGVTAKLALDTGSASTSIPSELMGRLRPWATTMHAFMTADGAIHISNEMLLREVRIGSLPVHDVAIGTEPTDQFVTLGMDVLSRFKVTIDFPGKQLALEPQDTLQPLARLDGWTGIALSRKGDAYVAAGVIGGSPAAVAGVRAGDKIVSVDRRQVSGLDIEAARLVLGGFAESMVQVEIERAGTRKTLRFRRKSDFDAPPGPLDGLEMVRPPNSSLRILNLLPTSVGAKAGLRAEDEVVSLDGQEVAKLTVEQLRPLLSGDKVKVSFKRTGQTKLGEVVLKTK